MKFLNDLLENVKFWFYNKFYLKDDYKIDLFNVIMDLYKILYKINNIDMEQVSDIEKEIFENELEMYFSIIDIRFTYYKKHLNKDYSEILDDFEKEMEYFAARSYNKEILNKVKQLLHKCLIEKEIYFSLEELKCKSNIN
jgi:hypothetical protein